jgi:hypothetical protein
VYWLVEQVYKLFVMIADTQLFSEKTLEEYGTRIYILLLIIMIFIVSFSMIKYIINPDDFLSEKKGVGQLLKNFFIVLIAIVAIPSVFKLAFEFQKIILKENVIAKIILGENKSKTSPDEEDEIVAGGKTMAATVFATFFKPNPQYYGETCNYPEYKCEHDKDSILSVFKTNLVENKDVLGIINEHIENKEIEATLKTKSGKKVKIVDYAVLYIPIISSVAGGFLIYILLVFCVDIAVRSVKLGFFQLIAPVPILSLLDPREKGSGMFNKWVKAVSSTYMGLFIRLIAIFFAIEIVNLISSGENELTLSSGESPNLFVKVFIIFGALLFAKQLPKLLEDLFGAKMDGGNMKMVNNIGKKAALGTAGLVGGGVASAIGNYRATKQWNQDHKDDKDFEKRSAFGSALAGGLAGGARGAVGGATGGRQGISSAVETTRANQQRRIDEENAGYDIIERNRDRLAAATGGKTKAQRMEQDNKQYEKEILDSKYNEDGTVARYGLRDEAFNAQQELRKYDGFSDDSKRLNIVNSYGEVTKTFENSSDIDTQRQLYMNEYNASPDATPEQAAQEKERWAAARFAEETGVSEAAWKEYEKKIRTKDAKAIATADYLAKSTKLHQAEANLANDKKATEKQKNLQNNRHIGERPAASTAKTKTKKG